MAKINLLPWREEVREHKNKEFLTLVFAVFLLSLLGAFATWSLFNTALDSQEQANDTIRQENKNLDKALEKIAKLEQQRDDIIGRMKVIRDLQDRRAIPVRIWEDVARLVPAQMYLTNMKREGDVITFTGQADNPTVVSDLIRKLDSTAWLENSKMISITQSNTTMTNSATLPSSVVKPSYPEEKYITFVITTNVKKAQATSSANVIKQTSSTITTSVASTTQ